MHKKDMLPSGDDKRTAPQAWTVVSSEYLIRRPWLTARKDHVRLPSGVENTEYWVLEYPAWVNVIAVTTDGRIVMEQQYRHGLGITAYELPAGVVEAGEEPLAAAQRELLEETGYTGGEWQLLTVLSPNASACSNLNYSFVATGVEHTSTQHLEPTEDISVQLMQPDEVRRLLRTDAIKQALMAAPLWKYFATRI